MAGKQASKKVRNSFYIYIYIYIYCKNCSLALHNIRKIRPFLTQHAAQLLDQALVISRLDYCNAQSIIWQHFHPTQSNLYRWFRMQQHDWSLANPKEPMLHLSLSPCTGSRIKFKTLMLAYRTTTGSAPSYYHSLITIYIPSRSLRSASERRLVVPSQRGTKSLSRTFHSLFLAGGMNNFQATNENSSLPSSLDLILKKNLSLNLSLFGYKLLWTMPILQILHCIVCLFIMYRLLYSSIASRFG